MEELLLIYLVVTVVVLVASIKRGFRPLAVAALTVLWVPFALHLLARFIDGDIDD